MVRNARCHRVAVTGAIVLAAALVVPLTGSPAGAADGCTPPTNPVACENTLAGTPGWEDGEDPSIEGFATEMSTDVGGTVSFKINTASTAYHVDIYRQGWYGGVGARRVATLTPTVALPQDQPACFSVPATGLVDCSNWAVSASWAVPPDAVSGVYRAVLVREDGAGGTNHITFVIRSDASHSDLVVQTSDTTWQAYNVWGGNSLYQGGPGTGPNRAYKVSYNRPTELGTYFDGFETAEYAFVRWVERNGYDVSYISGVDTDRDGAALLNHRAFVSVGHDEYWSDAQRSNVEAARDAGVDLAFLSGNQVYWKTRWEPGLDGGDRRTLVSYKESYAPSRLDPTGIWTGTWQDPRNGGGDPSNSLTGTLFVMNGLRYDALSVPAAYQAPRLWRGTSSWSSPTPAGVLGIEWDTVPDNGKQPPGLIRLSSTTVSSPNQVVTDLDGAGITYGAGSPTHSLTLYRAASGALVFSAGTIQWSWALDPEHSRATMATDPRIQQATVNLFADLGAQPRTLQVGLTLATASTDTTGASAAFTQPAAGASVPAGQAISVTGTATDAGGGVPAGVEVSTDNGTTWHPAAPGATGFGTWTYTWTPPTPGAVTLRARATDDSANLGAVTSRSVTVTAASCPCTLFGQTVPGTPTVPDASSVELGVQFSAASSGSITGVRFYKGGTTNGGTHLGRLWTSSGALLASATFTGESASGWQSVTFASPVAVTAGTTYVASYYAPQGHYAGTAGFFASPFVNPPLTASSGTYRYRSGGGFPTTASTANYWVDVTFTSSTTDTTPPSVVGTVPGAGATGVATTTHVSATLSEALAPGATLALTRNGSAVAGSSTYDAATDTMRFAPGAPLSDATTYAATLTGATDLSGNAMAPLTWSFTTGAATTPCSSAAPCTILESEVPDLATVADGGPLAIGVRFSASVDGSITGVRFYKGSTANSGTHTGQLWSASGTLLASATFTGESASGWQSVTFASPVAITAGTTYLASYHAPTGHYSADVGLFASPYTNAPLTATAGTYQYGASGSFPATSSTHSYAVDVTFTTEPVLDTTPPSVVSTVPGSGATAVSVSTPVTATLSEAIQAGAALTLTAGVTTVAGTSTYDTATQSLRFTPTTALAPATTYTATATGVRDTTGNTMAPDAWTFTTAAATPTCSAATPCSVFGPGPPGIPIVADGNSVELGTVFTSSVSGSVTGVRFFKGGAANGGTHTGRLWSGAGTLLATASFVSESGSGWQTVLFSTPVTITAGAQYVATYLAPQGGYSADVNGLASPVTTGPLTALGARYRYGTGGVFPTSASAHNYWIDVLFTAA